MYLLSDHCNTLLPSDLPGGHEAEEVSEGLPICTTWAHVHDKMPLAIQLQLPRLTVAVMVLLESSIIKMAASPVAGRKRTRADR